MNERDMSLLKAVGEAIREQLAVVQQKYESALSAQFKEIENLTEKVKKLSEASPDESAIVRAVLAQIVVPVAPELPDIQQLVKDAVSTIQLPEAPELPDIEGMISKAVQGIQIPQPAIPDIEKLVKDAVSALPVPEVPKTPELPDIERMVRKAVEGIHIPSPELPDIQLMVNEAVSALPVPKDGEPGEDGKDALQLEIMPCIDEEKSYPRGSYAIHHGGVWRSYQKTTGLNGWECLVDGISAVDISQANEREFTITAQLASGTRTEKSFCIPVMIYRDIFKDGEKYLPGDSVTWAGSVWYCHAETTDKPGEPSSKGWKLAVKRGRDARAKT
ncbi:phage gp6-like head-tail connector protein [Rahnella contaminans]|uniref:phage gp6-like head-tail connector protein n=1 Tax=Rahnella contaminans TaxID=2703882 RepID=UPI0023DC3838|nr:phage gp6-like head-tail connector protein [Rahnella contaminans]MDF1895087.1 phage gp6-like head-tail connector protein [Rahnella contaminans]